MSLSAYTLATSGRISEARAVLTALEQPSLQRYVPPCAIAVVYAGLNDDEGVFEWLEKALAVRDVHLIYVLVDPKWDPFRQDGRFQDLSATVRLCWAEAFDETLSDVISQSCPPLPQRTSTSAVMIRPRTAQPVQVPQPNCLRRHEIFRWTSESIHRIVSSPRAHSNDEDRG